MIGSITVMYLTLLSWTSSRNILQDTRIAVIIINGCWSFLALRPSLSIVMLFSGLIRDVLHPCLLQELHSVVFKIHTCIKSLIIGSIRRFRCVWAFRYQSICWNLILRPADTKLLFQRVCLRRTGIFFLISLLAHRWRLVVLKAAGFWLWWFGFSLFLGLDFNVYIANSGYRLSCWVENVPTRRFGGQLWVRNHIFHVTIAEFLSVQVIFFNLWNVENKTDELRSCPHTWVHRFLGFSFHPTFFLLVFDSELKHCGWTSWFGLVEPSDPALGLLFTAFFRDLAVFLVD